MNTLNNTLDAGAAARVRECEAMVIQRLHEQSMQIPASELARVDDLCPATVSRGELVEFLAAPPNDFWAGYGLACYVFRIQLAAVAGREFF